ncbi:MAG TPA: hypothetical protein VMC83_00905 [Streptosporangiaceae bacterium]|nr:hypothetical protein [Streptosporangiaceae bacterium]
MKDGSRRRQQAKTLKQELPYPYNQDLSKVLRGLNRRTPFGRRRQANDPVTAAYLVAAVRLIQRHLGPGPSRTPADPEDPDSISRPLLSFLSQRAVAAEVDHNPPPFHRLGRVSTMRERWRHQSDFVADVLRFGLWASHYPAAHQDEIADAEEEVIRGMDPVRGIDRVCYWDMTRLLATPMFRLSLIAAAQAEGDAVIGEAVSGRHEENGLRWKNFYNEFLRSRGLRLRPGVTLDDCVNLLEATADGLAMRALADPAARIFDHSRRRSLLGTAVLALIAGCLERGDGGDGRSLEQAVRDMACGRPVGSDRQWS